MNILTPKQKTVILVTLKNKGRKVFSRFFVFQTAILLIIPVSWYKTKQTSDLRENQDLVSN